MLQSNYISFQKVSYTEYEKDCLETGFNSFYRTEDIEKQYNALKNPSRGTRRSAGYDIFMSRFLHGSPAPYVLHPGFEFVYPTGIRFVAPESMSIFLDIRPRSSLGCKYLRGANFPATVDQDYYKPGEREGHILLKLRNEGQNSILLNPDKAIVQGIIMPYLITSDDSAENERIGGFGSTDQNS